MKEKIARYSKALAAGVSTAVMFLVAHQFLSEGDGRTIVDAVAILVNLVAVALAPKNRDD